MKLAYQQAVISFCPDLTDPKAKSIPIATLLVGEEAGARIGAVVVSVPEELVRTLDPISRIVLADAPQLLRRHVDEAFTSMPPTTPLGTILQRTYDALRNTLQVAEIDKPGEASVRSDDEATFAAEILKLAIGRLRKAGGMPFPVRKKSKAGSKARRSLREPFLPPTGGLSVWRPVGFSPLHA